MATQSVYISKRVAPSGHTVVAAFEAACSPQPISEDWSDLAFLTSLEEVHRTQGHGFDVDRFMGLTSLDSLNELEILPASKLQQLTEENSRVFQENISKQCLIEDFRKSLRQERTNSKAKNTEIRILNDELSNLRSFTKRLESLEGQITNISKEAATARQEAATAIERADTARQEAATANERADTARQEATTARQEATTARQVAENAMSRFQILSETVEGLFSSTVVKLNL